MIRRLFFMLTLAAGVTACSSSMTTPSGTSATITGSVVSSAPSSGPMDEAAVDNPESGGLVVIVDGTKVQVTVNADGTFTLTGVSAGDVVLRFRGTDVDAKVTVPGVQSGQSITIVVSITNGAAELESDDRELEAGGLLQLEGRIDSIPPVSAAGTFVVDGKTVTTDANTVFTSHGATATFADLVVGVRVHVAGTANGTGLLATTVMIQNTNAALPVVLNGTVQALTGTSSSFSFTVDGTVVNGDTTTSFKGNSSFTNLANGVRVEVQGVQGNGFVTATSIHVNPN